MKLVLILLLLIPTLPVTAQEFLGKWKVVRIFTTLDHQQDNGNRMLTLVNHSQNVPSPTDGVLLPRDSVVEFVILPGSREQHVTLTYQGLLLLSLNWKAPSAEAPPGDPDTPILRVWGIGESDFNLYSLLYVDSETLVFSDQGPPGSRFLDIYQLERVN